MRIKEQWKQPVNRSSSWKTIFFVVILLVWILAFGQIVFDTRFERLGWAVSLLLFWVTVAERLIKQGWRSWPPSQVLLLVGYTFVAGGHLFSQGTAASWLTSIGAVLLIGTGILAISDFRKSRASTSTGTVPPT